MTPTEVAEQLERLRRAGWQVGDYQLKHEPLWRRFVRRLRG